MTAKKPMVVRLERLPHRHAEKRVRRAFRILRKMSMASVELSIETKRIDKEEIVQEQEP